MEKNIKYNENDVDIIMKQTNYTYEESCEKLSKHNFDKLNVIREYLGKAYEPVKPVHSKQINQEIYKQIRKELDFSMSNYNKKNPINIEHAISNLQESENNLIKGTNSK
jgi:hypothetical protein